MVRVAVATREAPVPPKKDGEEEFESCTGCVGTFIVLVAMSAVTGLCVAFVLQKLWGWFLSPLTTQPPPSLATVWGLLVMVHLTVRTSKRVKKQTSLDVANEYAFAIVQAAVGLGIGYLIHQAALAGY